MERQMEQLSRQLGEIQRLLGERFGTDILTDGQRTVSCLMDMLPADTQSHNRMRMFYASHADSALLTEGLPAEQRARRAANIYAGYTDCPLQLALSLMDAILAATGELIVLPVEPARPAEPETEGLSLEKIKRILAEPAPPVQEQKKPAAASSPAGGSRDAVLRAKTTQNRPTAIERILSWPCVRVRQPDIYPILRKAMEWQEDGVNWEAEWRAVQERSLDDGHHYQEYRRLVELCRKNASHDADCMQLLADWYHDGLTVLSHGRQRTLVVKIPNLSCRWEDKAAEAGHCTAVFNQAVRARDEGKYSSALDLAIKALNLFPDTPRTDDAIFLAALLVEKDFASGGKPVQLGRLLDRAIIARDDEYASRENREHIRSLIRHLEQMGVKPTST